MIESAPLLEALAPLAIVALSALLLVLSDALLLNAGEPARERELGIAKGSYLAAISSFFLFLALGSAVAGIGAGPREFATTGSMLWVDGAATFAMVLLCGSGLLTIWLSYSQLPSVGIHHGEFYPLVLLSIAGGLGVVCAGNLISLFVAVELMSVPLYVLAGFDRDRARSNEAGMRSMLAGGFSSAISLYGIALIYGATGHFDYPGIRDAAAADAPLAVAGVALLLVGLLSRMGVAPFHQWWPDLAEGSPAIIAACAPLTVLLASAFALIRLLDLVVLIALPDFKEVLVVIAAISMSIGALMALLQSNVKRLLAYGAVAHMGFVILALAVANDEGRSAALVGIAVFLFMQLGAFGAFSSLVRRGAEWAEISAYSGFSEHRPILAATISLFLFSLAGLPGTAGFISRFVVTSAAMGEGWLLAVGLMGIASVVLFAAYLRVVAAMYMRGAPARESEPLSLPSLIAVSICAMATLYFGLFPGQGPLAFGLLDVVASASAR